jgi:hypothetical protein
MRRSPGQVVTRGPNRARPRAGISGGGMTRDPDQLERCVGHQDHLRGPAIGDPHRRAVRPAQRRDPGLPLGRGTVPGQAGRGSSRSTADACQPWSAPPGPVIRWSSSPSRSRSTASTPDLGLLEQPQRVGREQQHGEYQADAAADQRVEEPVRPGAVAGHRQHQDGRGHRLVERTSAPGR